MAVDTNSINQEKAYAVLIGCSEYNFGLNAIPPVKGNLEDMRSLLMDKSYVGLLPGNVFTSFNETSDSIKDLLFTTSRLEMDTLIIYYTGHGLRTGAKELCLAATNSKKLNDTEWLAVVEYEFIKRVILEQCNARQKILLIDACRSGLAVQSADDEIFKASGACVLASSQAGDESYFNPLEKNTCFTGTILDILRKGIDATKAKISLEDLYETSKEILGKKNLPQPELFKGEDSEEDYSFSLNPAFSFEKLKEKMKSLFAEEEPENALYQLELLSKQYPGDDDFEQMKSAAVSDALYAKLVQQGNELFYTAKNYAAAAEKYGKALQIKNTDTTVKSNLKICNENLLAGLPTGKERQQPLPGAEKTKRHDRKKNTKRLVLPLLFLVTAGALGASYPIIFETNETSSIPKIPDTTNIKVIKPPPVYSLKSNVKTKGSQPETAANLYANLENTLFEDLATNKKITIYNIQNSKASFQGRFCGYDVYGKLKMKNRTFTVISGNLKGSFSISVDSSSLTGNFIIEEVAPCLFELSRRNQ